jgi:hypothetical protein
VINGLVVQGAVLPDEGLAHQIEGGVVEVFGGKGCLVYQGKARVTAGDDVLWNQGASVPFFGSLICCRTLVF